MHIIFKSFRFDLISFSIFLPSFNLEFNKSFKPNLKTLIYLVLGLSLFALGETLLITANQGVSPWTVLAQGISFQTNLSIGVTTFIVSLIVLILWYPLKQKPGLGTILNVILIYKIGVNINLR